MSQKTQETLQGIAKRNYNSQGQLESVKITPQKKGSATLYLEMFPPNKKGFVVYSACKVAPAGFPDSVTYRVNSIYKYEELPLVTKDLLSNMPPEEFNQKHGHAIRLGE
jgi:hypothetical protein